MIKRLFDLLAAAVALALLSPVLLVVAPLVWATSRGPVFFRQERIGREFRPFRIYKFRSMVQEPPERQPRHLRRRSADHPRGPFLRATKIDELPQLINVLVGDMSLVGPRPEVRKYVEMFRDDYAEVLRVRPGITDPASIKYRHEAEILGRAADPGKRVHRAGPARENPLGQGICPESSLWLDFMIILKTIHVVGRRDRRPALPDPAKSRGNETADRCDLEPRTEYKPLTAGTWRSADPQNAPRLQVPFFRPSISEAEIEEVAACLRSGWLTTGPRTKQFEAGFAAAVGGQACLGREFLHGGAAPGRRGPGAGPGQAVLVPTMTFAATAEVVRYQGAVPLLVDCDPATLNMDLADAAAEDRRSAAPAARRWTAP